MRDIRFRAWDRVSRQIIGWDLLMKMLDGEYICCPHKEKVKNNPFDIGLQMEFSEYIGNIFNVNNFILMQWTRLLDKSGKEIYEGDIVKSGNFNYTVTWDSFGWALFDFIGGIGCNEEWLDGVVEVIGNIYEHKYLLDNTDTKA